MILAGILIGIGVVANLTAENSIIGSFLFSLGLLSIIKLKLPLFTGKVGFPQFTWNYKMKVLLLNLIGVGALVFFSCIANENLAELLKTAAAAKFSKDFLALFAKAYLCGILIHLAVTIKQDLITVLCVMGFILIGAEHCIADFPYLLINISFINIIKYLTIILGNTAGALFLQQLLTEGP